MARCRCGSPCRSGPVGAIGPSVLENRLSVVLSGGTESAVSMGRVRLQEAGVQVRLGGRGPLF